MSISVRPYQVHDRSCIRKISCAVANRGEPIDQYFPDEEVTADLLTMYYLDYEPEATFVAIIDGQVVGYIMGSLDNRSHGLVMIFLILPQLLFKAIIRGVFVNKHIQQMIKVMMGNWKRMFHWRKQSFNSHEAHIHLGIMSAYRHQGVGKKLIETFQFYALSNKVKLLSASVHSLNTPACKFFEHQGFHLKSSCPMEALYRGQLEQYAALTYVKELS